MIQLTALLCQFTGKSDVIVDVYSCNSAPAGALIDRSNCPETLRWINQYGILVKPFTLELFLVRLSAGPRRHRVN